jgi:iron complex outermembrane recepter protein
MTRHTTLALAAIAALHLLNCAMAQTSPDRVPERTHEKLLNEILVTADPLQRAAHDPVQPTEVLAGAELEDQRRASIGETVALQTGVQSSYFGPGVGRPIVRGLDGARVQVLSGGTGALDASTVSVDHAVTIEPFLADQIEVLKGPSTLFFGSGAIGGVVNVVDGRIPEAPIQGFSGRAELGADTGANADSGMARLDIGNERGVLHFDVFSRDTGDVEAPGTEDGHIENSAMETNGGAIGGSLFGARGFIGAAVSSYSTFYGIPPVEEETASNSAAAKLAKHEGEERVRIDMEQTRFDAKGGLQSPLPGIEQLVFKFSQNDYQHVELEGDEVGTRFNVDAYESRLEFVHAPAGKWTGAFGLQFGDRDLSAVGEEAFIPPSDTRDWGVFLVERADFAPFSLELGTRFDRQDIDADNTVSARHDALSISIGAAWRFADNWSLAGGFDRAQRAPSTEELFSAGPHIATQSFEHGDSGLSEETANQIEAGLHFDSERTHLKLSIFRNRFNDFIYLDDTGEIEDDLPVRQWTQADARFRGFEGEIRTMLADTDAGRFDLRVFADVVEGKLASGEHLPRIAPARIGSALNWTTGGWRAALTAIRYATQDNTAEFETETAGYTLVNANVSYAFSRGRNEWEVFAEGSNLSNREAHVHTSFLKDVAPLPGRNLRFGVRLFF